MDASMFWNEKKSFMDKATLKRDTTVLFNDKSTLLFRKLLENSSFRELFLKRYDEILNTHYSFERLTVLLNQFESEYTPYIQANIDRWAHPRTMEDYTIRIWKDGDDVVFVGVMEVVDKEDGGKGGGFRGGLK